MTLEQAFEPDVDVVELAPRQTPQRPVAPLAEIPFHHKVWLPEEIRVLRTVYVEEGVDAAMALLPNRARQSIYVQANKLGIHTKHRPTRHGIYRALAAEALALRSQGLSYVAIGRELGMCEATATNAVLVGECIAAGNEPLERGPDGRISSVGRERLRKMFRKGLKHRDMQLACGVAATTISRERKLYEKERKEQGLRPLPQRGGGERYSGVPVPQATKDRAERLYLEGYGTQKVRQATGVSNTHCLRIRRKLVDRLAAEGKTLPGCDLSGVRRGRLKESLHYNHAKQFARLEDLLLDGWSVARAAIYVGMGRSRADKHVHQRIAEGAVFPKAEWRGRPARALQAIPRRAVSRFRQLLDELSLDDARRAVLAEMGCPPDPLDLAVREEGPLSDNHRRRERRPLGRDRVRRVLERRMRPRLLQLPRARA